MGLAPLVVRDAGGDDGDQADAGTADELGHGVATIKGASSRLAAAQARLRPVRDARRAARWGAYSCAATRRRSYQGGAGVPPPLGSPLALAV